MKNTKAITQRKQNADGKDMDSQNTETSKQTVSALLVDQFRERILHKLFIGELKQGDFIGTESDLIKEFNISRLPVRDALQHLKAIGIIDIKVGSSGGIYLAKADPKRFADALAVQLQFLGINEDELFLVQQNIEGLAAELAAKNMTSGHLMRLEEIYQELKDQLDDKGRNFIEKSFDFRQAVAEVSGNQILIVLLQVLRTTLSIFYREHEPEGPRAGRENVIRMHGQYLKYLADKDATGAREHIKEYIRKIQKIRQDSMA